VGPTIALFSFTTNQFPIGGAFSTTSLRLSLPGLYVDNWDNPEASPTNFWTTNYLSPNSTYTVQIEYKNTAPTPWIRLSWMEPGGGSAVPVPRARLFDETLYTGPTGLSVDAGGRVWVSCFNSSAALRIDPQAGVLVTNGAVVSRLGAVDLVVDLGSGYSHPEPFNKPATPYNYSDMTGFNNRIVNPGLAPLKGYWAVIHDCGVLGEIWKRVVWSHSMPAGCADEVFVRASDDRAALANEAFAAVTNDTPVAGVQGRYIEVRYGMTRANASQQPALSDLTLYGSSTSYDGDLFLEGGWAHRILQRCRP
jgi:hypothetical protein